MNKIFLNISRVVGILSWFLYAIYEFCRKDKSFWEDINSSIHIIGKNSIDAAGVLSIIGVVLSTIILIKYKNTKSILLNTLLNYSIFLIIIGPVIILYITFAL